MKSELDTGTASATAQGAGPGTARGPVRLIREGAADFARTQALYHAVAQGMTAATPDTVILIRPRTPYLCLGWHDAFDAVLDRGACAFAGLPVLRRRVGGGTTYLDSAQPFYQFVFHHTRAPAMARALYEYLLAAPVLALRRIGLDAALRDTNEIELTGRRIAGIGGGRIGEAAVVVGNILCDFDYAVLPGLWNAPWPAFRELAAQALRERLTTLRAVTGAADPEALTERLAAILPEALGRPVVLGAPTAEEEARTARLERQLGSAEFLDLHAERAGLPMRRLKIAAGVFIHGESVAAGLDVLQVTLRERDGRVEAARVEGPPGLDPHGLGSALIGAPMSEWRMRLNAG